MKDWANNVAKRHVEPRHRLFSVVLIAASPLTAQDDFEEVVRLDPPAEGLPNFTRWTPSKGLGSLHG